MKKVIIVISSLLLTSCSIFTEADEEPSFLEKHNMSVWENTANSDSEQKGFMRILNEPNKYSELWASNNPDILDDECYNKNFNAKLFNLKIHSNEEDSFSIKGFIAKGDTFEKTISLYIRNDSLFVSHSHWKPHGGYSYTSTWVRSEVDVEYLKLCD